MSTRNEKGSEMSTRNEIQITTGRNVALEKRIAKRLLELNPGLGPVAQQQAELLADTGLRPVEAAMLLEAVYQPSKANGRGQSQRSKALVEALVCRYGDRLQRAANNFDLMRTLIAEMEEVSEMRDQIGDAGASFSFADTLLLDGLGCSAHQVSALMAEERWSSAVAAKCRIMAAARLVESGQFATLEGALNQGGGEFEYE